MSQKAQMPPSYLRCTAAEGSCPLRETCLRSRVHREATYSGRRISLTVVNIWNSYLHPLTADCQAYRKAEKRRFACGFTHLFDPVPRGVYAEVQQQVERVFSNRLFYFQCSHATAL